MVLLLSSKKQIKVFTPVISEDRAYWLMHFAAVLDCLHNHKVLTKSPRQGLGEDWSLAWLREWIEPGALHAMEASISNWGAQYLLTYLFNENALGIRDILMNAIAELANHEFVKSECYVSGKDSISGATFLNQCKARLFFDGRRRVRTSQRLVRFTDLCILTSVKDRPDPLAFFGEVEGIHGSQMLTTDYWVSKSEAATFGVGFVPKATSPYTLQVLDTEYGPRVIFIAGTERSVLGDFHLVVNFVDKLLQDGVQGRQWWRRLTHAGVAEVVDLMASCWERPVIELLDVMHIHSMQNGPYSSLGLAWLALLDL